MDKQPFYQEDNIDWEVNSYLNGMLLGAMLCALTFAGLLAAKQYVDNRPKEPAITNRVVTRHGTKSDKIYKIKRVFHERPAR